MYIYVSILCQVNLQSRFQDFCNETEHYDVCQVLKIMQQYAKHRGERGRGGPVHLFKNYFLNSLTIFIPAIHVRHTQRQADRDRTVTSSQFLFLSPRKKES